MQNKSLFAQYMHFCAASDGQLQRTFLLLPVTRQDVLSTRYSTIGTPYTRHSSTVFCSVVSLKGFPST
jgi:hypothetical protein